MPKTGDAVFLDAFCPQCEAPYYRSVRPVVIGKDSLQPELFAPIDADTPPPDHDRPACPVCKSTLRFVAAAKPADRTADRTVDRTSDSVSGAAGTSAPPAAAPASAAASSVSMEVLFEAGDDESVLDISKGRDDESEFFLVVSNKRIVRIRVHGVRA